MRDLPKLKIMQLRKIRIDLLLEGRWVLPQGLTALIQGKSLLKKWTSHTNQLKESLKQDMEEPAKEEWAPDKKVGNPKLEADRRMETPSRVVAGRVVNRCLAT